VRDTEDDPETFDEYFEAALPLIDDALAKENIGLLQRPLRAAITFVTQYVIEVDIDGKPEAPRFADGAFTSEPWFRGLFQLVEEWYRQRYGAAMDKPYSREAMGFVVVWGTPFKLEVPTRTVTVGTPGKTIWLGFPESVLPGEDPTQWIVDPPNISGMTRKDFLGLARKTKEVGNLLRSIEVKLLGIGRISDTSRGFIQAIRGHLVTAAQQVIENWERKGTSKAAWEMQMVCECALKALSNEKLSTFRETHDLFTLYDDVLPFLGGLKRTDLTKLPRWKQMADLRYGQGRAPEMDECYKMYLATLRVVDGALAPLVSLGLGEARIEVALAPWKTPSGEDD
jgi:hypothetical protein